MAKQPLLLEDLTTAKIEEMQKRFHQLCDKISVSLTAAGATPEAVLATLPETRQQLYQLRCGATLSKPSRKKS